MNKVKKAQELVDLVFKEGFDILPKIKLAENKVDKILDECGRCGNHEMTPEEYDEHEKDEHGPQGDPADVELYTQMYNQKHPEANEPMGDDNMDQIQTLIAKGITPEEYAEDEREEHGRDDYEDVEKFRQAYYGEGYDEDDDEDFNAEFGEGPEQEDDPQKLDNDINHVPNQNADELFKSVIKQIGEVRHLSENDKEEYKKFFDSMLNKYGVNSPAELNTVKKKEFFDAVDKGWKGKKEVSEGKKAKKK